ncbi:hypothetical protein [Methylobacterium planeticum]|uniref:hypothetical protein n=1 Tax=Methylobacterium planeticum TaxID=2615211 RepID=UPI0017848D5A|nr:hypothetical protein [Methylobacterium planeticum]
MQKQITFAASLLAAGLFLTSAPASAAQIGVAAVPEAATSIDLARYGYGGGYGRGYGHRGHYGHGYRRGGYGGGYGRHFGGHNRHHNYGYGRSRGYDAEFGRRRFF